MWGQGLMQSATALHRRIIPTRVGTSILSPILSVILWDHPHACGDKTKLSTSFHKGAGSSPRVWGQELFFSAYIYSIRIIPTRVGTRVYHTLPYNYAWDHPHACGDKSAPANIIQKGVGSSPRVWGQVHHA